MRKLFPLIVTTALISPTLAFAQEDDRGWLTRTLEENLSGAGRSVEIIGFTGALSSRATMTRMTIADDEGIWLQLDNVVLDWSRSALLTGRVIVNELSAEKITLTRLPKTEEDALSVEAEPFTFSLPELPVSVDIGALLANEIHLGPEVIGQELRGRLEAKLHLADGNGTTEFNLQRSDEGPAAEIALTGSFANETGLLEFELSAEEEAGGLVATALALPGAPAAALTLSGKGTLDDFAAEFALQSDDEPRLAGPISIKAMPEGAGHDFMAKLRGNPAPLFMPEYAEFLGENLGIEVTGQALSSGALKLPHLYIDGEALQMIGSLELAADKLPEKIDVTGSISHRDGSPVLLPLSGEETRISRADLNLKFDAQKASDWQLDLTVQGLDRSDLKLSQAKLEGTGQIDRQDFRRGVNGDIRLDTKGLAFNEAALQKAVGEAIEGALRFDWREGDGILTLTDIDLSGADYGLTGNLGFEGLDDSMRISGDISVLSQDLSRFSAIAGQNLAGRGDILIAGNYVPLSGAFEADLLVNGTGLQLGIAEADRLLAGNSVIEASAKRDEQGIELRYLDAKAASLALTAQGNITSKGENNLSGRFEFGNLADLGGSYGGALRADFGLKGMMDDLALTLTGQSSGLRIGQEQADKLIGGEAQLNAALGLREGKPRIDQFTLNGSNVSADITGQGDQGALNVSARLRDLGVLLPEFPGPVTLSGQLVPEGSGYRSDIQVQGPAAINSRIAGVIDANQPNLSITGTSTAALANGFIDPVSVAGTVGYDLRLTGWSLADINGQANLSAGRIAVPARGMSLEDVSLQATLAAGQLRLDSRARPMEGGSLQLTGPLALTSPFNADLTLEVIAARLRDPELFDTSVSGTARIQGPLLGNANLTARMELGETEIIVPSTGFASAADLEKIDHIRDTAPVRATRARAGLGQSGGQTSSASSGLPNWGVNLILRAPRQVFIRGRGLDAELGGEIRVGGTLNNLIPAGGLDLIRGRLDILGKRLDLMRASLTLEGDFNAYLDVMASNAGSEVTSVVSIIGPASEPEVAFSSEPPMAQEEVLAYLLFDRGLETLSAFQALQLANAVANLAGKGGEGIVNRLRRGFGFDDLDVQTSPEGNTSVTAGKYISENVYTEVGVDQSGNTRINLNLDLKRGLTAKARVDSDGSSGIGIYLEKDY